MEFLTAFLDETVDAFTAFRDGADHRRVMEEMADTIVERFRAGNKLMICGNGGSAADSQHIAAEFISRLMFDRAPLPALALTTDSSNLTAIGNDYGYEKVFERQVLGLGQEGDILIGISTSGTSKNVLRAFEAAKTKGVICFAFAGATPGPMRDHCQTVLAAPSTKTAIIQQIHITAAHIVCALVERTMFPRAERMPATIKQAAILVGGLGTRLGALTAHTPKPLLPCGDRPFLAWVLRELCRFGIEETLLLTGYLSEEVERMLPDLTASLPKPMRLICCPEQGRAGTGGALHQARANLADRFLLCNGDSWLDFNLARLLADAATDPDDTIVRMVLRHLPDATRAGVAELDGNRVTAFRERPLVPGQPGLANAGFYLLRRSILDHVADPCSLERDVLPGLATAGLVRGTVGDGYFVDIGIPADLERAQTELPARLHRRALFLDRDGVINHDHGWVGEQDRFEFIPGAIDAMRAAADAGWHVFVVTNQSGIARGRYDEAQFATLSSWMIDQIRAGGGNVDDLRFCPTHPEAPLEAYRRADPRRKPGPGMLQELIAAWQLDPARCLLVGDQPTDLQAAAACAIPAHLFPGGDLADFVRPLL